MDSLRAPHPFVTNERNSIDTGFIPLIVINICFFYLSFSLDRAVHLDECLSRVTNDQSLSQILKRIFSKDYYKQLVLTEIGGIPYSYRRGKVDSLTKEVESKLRSSEPL